MATYDTQLNWFEWNGVRSTDYGIIVLNQPPIMSAKERLSQVTIPGRSGTLTVREGPNVFDDITYSVSCTMDDSLDTLGNDIPSQIASWLRGYGRVCFANRPHAYWFGRVTNQIQFDKVVAGNTNLTFSIQFGVEPFYYFDYGLVESTITQNSQYTEQITYEEETAYRYPLYNPGNVPAAPILTITGTDLQQAQEGEEGEDADDAGFIVCGDTRINISTFSDVTNITIDNNAKYSYGEADGDRILTNGRLSGDWIEIPVTPSPLNPTHIIFSPSITSITIQPRWRCI